jgi:hypothetical protein
MLRGSNAVSAMAGFLGERSFDHCAISLAAHAAKRLKNRMSAPLISVLLVTFNQEAFVTEALNSVLAQTYSPLEIVVSDDASSDGTYAVLERLIGAYRGPHRVSLRRNPARRNVVGHLQDAVPFTSGELIVLAAGDDVSLPNRVAQLAEAWEASGRQAHALNSDLQQIDEHGARGTVLGGFTGLSRITLQDFLDRPAGFFGASAAYSRAVFERFGPLDPFNIFEDQVLPFRAAMLGHAAVVAEPLVLWRRLSQSNSMQFLQRPAQRRARLDKLIYQQQQLACYQRQRLADIATFLERGGSTNALPPHTQQIVQRIAQQAEAAATALQAASPDRALLGAVAVGKLGLKQALKLISAYRWPRLGDWWYRLRTAGR